MSKSCKNLANQTLFNLHLFDNVRYVFGDGDLGAHRRLAVAAADFPAANDGKPREFDTLKSKIFDRVRSELFFLSNLFSIFVVYISKYRKYETFN